jgi:hypothetical protein
MEEMIIILISLDYFNPATKQSLYRYPELTNHGKGTPVNYTGMTWSGFRPRYNIFNLLLRMLFDF